MRYSKLNTIKTKSQAWSPKVAFATGHSLAKALRHLAKALGYITKGLGYITKGLG